jgi:hypothetical protein
MSWFRNHYHCPHCRGSWTSEWSATCDDDCPHCGARHMSPTSSDDLTDVIEAADDGTFVVKRSPPSAEHHPDYVAIGRFRSHAAAERAMDGGGSAKASRGRRGVRPATNRQAIALDLAIARLQDARAQALAADCPSTVKKIRAALKSAAGAKRHMARRLGEAGS